ncbi:GFA family protein [Trinickia mobilis]|uniref:GFA family protein n=1 Tax=Trinickia mobilis TaxID=2816356 RepID=UPI001A8F7B9C|nr:GFA family protein [Trinickia mobilis]
MLTGGCFCGKVRYEVFGDVVDSTICHCVDCRRISAAPFVGWLTVKRSGFRFVDGEPKTIASSQAVLRAFCADCGTHLTYRHADFADEIDISTCSLDVPEQVPPKHHTWTAQKLPWVQLPDALPQYRGAYSSADPTDIL